MGKLTDLECHALAQQMAVGRTQKEMLPIIYTAHEAVTLATERDKHTQLITRRGALTTKGSTLHPNGQVTLDRDSWDDLTAHLGDRQGSNQITVALGLAWKALLQRDQSELEFQLYALFKAADATFPDVRGAIESKLAADHPPGTAT